MGKRIIFIAFTALLLLANGRVPTVHVGDVSNPPPQQDQPAATPQPTATPSPGPFYTVGNMWADTGDPGYCLGFTPYETGVSPPVLSWPVPGGTPHEGRGYRIGHPAVDIDAPLGRAVQAAAPGTVVWAGLSTFFGHDALVVAVSHGGGWVTVYAHLSVVSVACWQPVGTGEIIGRVGMTGSSTFPHLHFELRQGPYSYNPFDK